MADVPPYIREFMEAVYPGAADLAMASFDERTALVDATKTIATLRTELAECQKVNQILRADHDNTCARCRQPILAGETRASCIGIGLYYHERCWADDDDENFYCTRCGGEGRQESSDPLWDDADEVPCSACAGTGLRKHQSVF